MGKVYNLSNYDLNLRRQFVNSDRPGINEFLHYLYRLVFNEIATSAKVLEIGAGAGNKTGSNTLLIGLGVGGAVVIAIIIFAVTRKKT